MLNLSTNVHRFFSEENFSEIDFTPDVYLYRAHALALSGYHSESIKEAKKALATNPNLNETDILDFNELGLQLGLAGNYEDAVEAFKQDNHTTSFVHKYNLAIAYTLWKGPESSESYIVASEEEFNDLRDSAPSSQGTALYGLSGLALAKGEKETAIKLLKQAIKIEPPVIRWLATDPIWKLLEGDFEFQKIINLEIDKGT